MSKKLTQRLSFRLHQWLGLASAAVLLVVGLTGALLALEDQITDAWPKTPLKVSGAPLTPPQLAPHLEMPGKILSRIYLESDPASPGRAMYLDDSPQGFSFQSFNPYTGELLGPRPAIEEFFADVMALHRWLLIPRSVGSLITGTAALMAIGLLIAGIIRRAPDKLSSLKGWLAWKKGAKGRHALWQFHALLGTWFFIPLLLMALTGPWFAFDWYRQGLTQMLGSGQGSGPVQSQGREVNLDAAWQGFLSVKPDGQYLRWMMPRGPRGAITVLYLEADAPHHHAYSRLSLDAGSGALLHQQRYSDLQGGDYWLANIYALHTGLYFGLPGRIIWSLAGLAFGSFAVTGVWLFFNRRARPKDKALGPAQTLITYASQSGTAAAQGQRLKGWLDSQGHGAHLKALGNLAPAQLAAYQQVLVLASTYGEGEPPDSALGFQQQLAQAQVPLDGLKVGVWAFGASQYQQFCAFGHWLAERFGQLGAELLLPVTEVDRGAEHSIRQWSQALAEKLSLGGHMSEAHWQQAELIGNQCLNPGSIRAVHDIRLALPGHYQPGDLLELLPVRSEGELRAAALAAGQDPDAPVSLSGDIQPLWQALDQLEWQGPQGPDAQAWVDSLAPLAPRSYSIASHQGPVRLMVRHVIKDDGSTGLASGQLCQGAVGQHFKTRLKGHGSFRLPEDPAPLVLLGAGTGLAPYLGFLAQLRAQGRQGQAWLLFGERQPGQDYYYQDELEAFLADGTLARLDLAWSRSDGRYVQQALAQALPQLDQVLAQGAHLYVCGAIDGIGKGVHQVLLEHLGEAGVAALVTAGRYHRDLY
ncbi:PepSY domain-containing protein [Gallaecimonas xiamenensis]|uniref:Oxidoreductase FAD/NAD(P)-binding:PepSY-associated TM helix:flavodoxin/nitric oxide synthase n=1 Tax=Gallaecimonas xiamenensis 3-C-1 TaxID=745411 RepID=K2JPR6_9GAMM|nr:PepSY domain-containing protein [Gallaecimonas xiamenensis]EKE77183.1 oxidoreductase FAD/NAD(P)-binding:PepSY-associated TM helix:flavodoxin/nitric oxide synthase [Gallaecimonas xiamenensis 3-C-1]